MSTPAPAGQAAPAAQAAEAAPAAPAAQAAAATHAREPVPPQAGCELCELAVTPVFRDERLSVIIVDDAAYPGFCRVIWNDHVKEMSDLSMADRMLLNDAVWHVELALREVMGPGKVNVASLGNMTPHLHWHVIPRFADDAHFPNPVWTPAVRRTDEPILAARRALLPQLAANIARRLEKAP